MKKKSQGKAKTEQLAAEMFWNIMAMHKSTSHRYAPAVTKWTGHIRELGRVLAADVTFFASFPKIPPDAIETVHIPENCRYINPITAGGKTSQKLTDMQWNLPLKGTLLALTSDQPSQIVDTPEDFGPLSDCASVALKGPFIIGEVGVVVLAIWGEAPKHIGFIYQFGPTLLSVWKGLLIRSSIWANQIEVPSEDLLRELEAERIKIRERSAGTEIDLMAHPLPRLEDMEDDVNKAINTWAQEHSNPNIPLLAVGRKSYTPIQIASEVYRRTEIGKQLKQQVLQDSVNKILQR